MMKAKNFLPIAIALLFVAPFLQSCIDDDDTISLRYPNALVTVKTSSDNAFYLQLDENTTLYPINVTKSPFGDKEVRALVNYREEKAQDSHGFTKAVYVNWIDSILTKQTRVTLGDDDDKTFGKDPLEIYRDWVTIAEDGYLTLRFTAMWGYSGTTHTINLITGVNSENPYEVVLRHNANGDNYDHRADGLVAFDLSALPDTEGKTVKLKVRWQSFTGEKSTEFDYCTRKTTQVAVANIADTQATAKIE